MRTWHWLPAALGLYFLADAAHLWFAKSDPWALKSVLVGGVLLAASIRQGRGQKLR